MKEAVGDVDVEMNDCSAAAMDRVPLLDAPATVSIEPSDSLDDSLDKRGCCRICLEFDSPICGKFACCG